MKLFVYKTLFVVVCIFLLFQLTVGAKLKQFEEKLANYKSQENVENIKNKNIDKIANQLLTRLEIFDRKSYFLIEKPTF